MFVLLQNDDEDMIFMYNAYLHKLITCFLSHHLARDKVSYFFWFWNVTNNGTLLQVSLTFSTMLTKLSYSVSHNANQGSQKCPVYLYNFGICNSHAKFTNYCTVFIVILVFYFEMYVFLLLFVHIMLLS